MKRYLNSVEEVLKALKEGKDVIDKTDGSIYRLVDGILCHNYNDRTSINAGLMLYFGKIVSDFYTEEPEPLKFEVNRAYKTRNGRKVFLFSIDKEMDGAELHFIGESSYFLADFWADKNGIYKDNNNLDIIGYWEEE